MHGSPLKRTILMAVALFLTAIGIAKLTRPRVIEAPSAPVAAPSTEEGALIDTPFFLTLSAPAKEVILESGGRLLELKPSTQELSGSLPLQGDHPVIFLTVRWTSSESTPRFAKLRLEPEGISTQEQTFDSLGEIDDVWEPHLH